MLQGQEGLHPVLKEGLYGRECPLREVCEAVLVNLRVQARPQEFGDARIMYCLLKNATGSEYNYPKKGQESCKCHRVGLLKPLGVHISS